MSVLSNCELCLWNLGGDERQIEQVSKVSITKAKQALTDAGLNAQRAEGIPESTAFRRSIGTLVGKDLFARIWTRKKDGILTAKISEQFEDELGHLRYRDHSEYELTENSGVRQLNGPDDERLSVRNQYDYALANYTGADTSKIIQNVLLLDGLGAYSPRKNGGVYFVPIRPGAADLLDRIVTFCEAVRVRFLRYQVPDLSSQRDEIADAVANSLNADIEMHMAAIVAYSETSKPGVLENRRTAIGATAQLITNLSSLLNGKAAALHTRLADLLEDLKGKEAMIEAAAQTRRAAGPSRRIVTPAAAPSPAPPVSQPQADNRGLFEHLEDAAQTQAAGACYGPPE